MDSGLYKVDELTGCDHEAPRRGCFEGGGFFPGMNAEVKHDWRTSGTLNAYWEDWMRVLRDLLGMERVDSGIFAIFVISYGPVQLIYRFFGSHGSH